MPAGVAIAIGLALIAGLALALRHLLADAVRGPACRPPAATSAATSASTAGGRRRETTFETPSPPIETP